MTVEKTRPARGGRAGAAESAARALPAVWRLDLADPAWDVPAAAALLSAEERARAEAGTPAVERRRVLLRAALRVLLGRALGTAPDRVPLEVVDGRPEVRGRWRCRVQVSCSASDGVGLVALHRSAPVGVDVERHSDEAARQAAEEGWLAPPEREALARLPEAERWPAVTRCWTQKEAVLKGLGLGLRCPPASVVTPVSAHGRAGGWSLAPVAVPAGLVATLALRSPVPVPPFAVRDLPAGVLR